MRNLVSKARPQSSKRRRSELYAGFMNFFAYS